ncbi:hmg box protein [Grosmannia clavigera kw1407]|uniref:Hmg box protein n=1 Tax=Grosmannia clavigera (strain kw1407 / UAMH 11150) TaxID=655863 RepID=F0XD52_GROCL|nr:hmg box protein [Grosmannia clavigera kw1407]EFX04658.1 hmg box protein [Grosmannia clavigera kw1407]
MSDSDEDESENMADGDVRRGISALETLDPPSMSNGDFICLCTPAPKIPRPRNAFILFRQHYQAHVVAENPGLTNPDISKIIGKMWQKQPKDIKDEWKNLADKEKARHRIQYPDYRYQPRRVGKGASANGRSGIAGVYGSEGAGGNSVANGELDPSRCPKCGGRYIATPRTPSLSRYALVSAKMQGTPTSAIAMFDTSKGKSNSTAGAIHTTSASFESERNYRHGLSSPGPSQYSSVFDRNYQRESGRRPLPQHGRFGVSPGPGAGVGSGPGAAAGYIDDIPPEHKRRRYEMPAASPAHPARETGFVSYRPAPHQHYTGNPPPMTPTSAPLPSYHRPPQTWMDLPPPTPPRLATRSQINGFDARSDNPTSEATRNGGRLPAQYRSSSMSSYPSTLAHHPASQIQRTPVDSKFSLSAVRRPGDVTSGREYAPQLARLPPPGTSYGYYHLAESADNTTQPPTTPMTGLSMATATPRSASVVDPQTDASGAAGRQQQTRSGIADDSLKLPPLQTYMLPKAQSPPRSDSSNGDGGGESKSAITRSQSTIQPGSSVDVKMASDSVCNSAGSSGLQDLRSFAIAPIPMARDGNTDRDNQSSGIWAMVMSVPYLNKLEVLRRTSPPQTGLSKRGPIIAVEGCNEALIAEVGLIVEKALVQSGECAVGVWSTLADRGQDRPSSRGGDCAEENYDDQYSGSEALSSYHNFIVSWHRKSQEIIQHIKTTEKLALAPTPSASSSATPQPEERKGTGAVVSALADRAITPPAPPSPASPASATATPSPGHSPHPQKTQPPSATAARLPVALITGGYSLSISDHYATSVPIEDGFPPIGHWEWMATLWRGTAGPDLVIYADSKPALKPMDSVVNLHAQEGVMVFHVPSKPYVGSQDSANNKLVDDKSSRRLAFEVMEWVRTAGFCED